VGGVAATACPNNGISVRTMGDIRTPGSFCLEAQEPPQGPGCPFARRRPGRRRTPCPPPPPQTRGVIARRRPGSRCRESDTSPVVGITRRGRGSECMAYVDGAVGGLRRGAGSASGPSPVSPPSPRKPTRWRRNAPSARVAASSRATCGQTGEGGALWAQRRHGAPPPGQARHRKEPGQGLLPSTFLGPGLF